MSERSILKDDEKRRQPKKLKRGSGNRRLAKDLYKNLAHLFDEKTYKTKHFIEEFTDSLKANKAQVLSQSFQRSISRAFDEVDIDKSGTIDKAELYAGILLLYHNINMIPWGGRKPPPKREFVMNIFEEYLERQKEETGDYKAVDLTYEYFEKLCKDHFEVILSSVLGRIALVTFVFPFLSWCITEVLLLTPLRKVLMPLEEILPSLFLGLMIFALPYVENLIMRRLNSDTKGFAKFKLKEVKAGIIAKVDQAFY